MRFGPLWGMQGLVAVSLYDGRTRFEEEVRQLTGVEPLYNPARWRSCWRSYQNILPASAPGLTCPSIGR